MPYSRDFVTDNKPTTTGALGSGLVIPPVDLGRLDPPPGRAEHSAVALKDDSGQLLAHTNGCVLRDFPGVPRVLQPNTHITQVESWMRAFPDFRYSDLQARFPPHLPAWTKHQSNAFNNRRRREVRDRYKVREFSGRYDGRVTRAVVQFVSGLTDEQIAHNTSWVVTPKGIHPPGWPKELSPLDTYLDNGYPHQPSQEVRDARQALLRLNRIARDKGKSSWEQLDASEIPPLTFNWKRKNRRSKANDTLETDDAGHTALDDDTGVNDDEIQPRKRQKNDRATLTSQPHRLSLPGQPTSALSSRRLQTRVSTTDSTYVGNWTVGATAPTYMQPVGQFAMGWNQGREQYIELEDRLGIPSQSSAFGGEMVARGRAADDPIQPSHFLRGYGISHTGYHDIRGPSIFDPSPSEYDYQASIGNYSFTLQSSIPYSVAQIEHCRPPAPASNHSLSPSRTLTGLDRLRYMDATRQWPVLNPRPQEPEIPIDPMLLGPTTRTSPEQATRPVTGTSSARPTAQPSIQTATQPAIYSVGQRVTRSAARKATGLFPETDIESATPTASEPEIIFPNLMSRLRAKRKKVEDVDWDAFVLLPERLDQIPEELADFAGG